MFQLCTDQFFQREGEIPARGRLERLAALHSPGIGSFLGSSLDSGDHGRQSTGKKIVKNHAALRSTPASTRSTDAYNTAEPWLCHIGRVRTATSRLAFSPSCRQWRSLTTTGVMPALRCGRTSAMSRSDLRSASPTDRGPAGDHTTAMLDLGSATIKSARSASVPWVLRGRKYSSGAAQRDQGERGRPHLRRRASRLQQTTI